MELMIAVIACIIAIEATTGILVKSDIFKPVRAFFFERRDKKICKFIHDVLDCSYCTSVWVSLFYATMLALYINNALPHILALFFIGLVLHRLSNVLHHLIDRIDSSHNDNDLDKVN
jgi:uncharacterized membrane protein